MSGTLIGRDRADFDARRAALIADISSDFLDARTGRWVMGTFDEARAMVQAYEDAGAQRLMMQTFLPFDVEHVRVMGEFIAG